MRIRSILSILGVTVCALGFLALSACDFSSQNVEWTHGDSLGISQPGGVSPTVTIPSDSFITQDYYVQAFNRSKDYTWTINGTPADSVWRGGEFMTYTYDEPGTYTIKVSDGQYAGTVEITATEEE